MKVRKSRRTTRHDNLRELDFITRPVGPRELFDIRDALELADSNITAAIAALPVKSKVYYTDLGTITGNQTISTVDPNAIAGDVQIYRMIGNGTSKTVDFAAKYTTFGNIETGSTAQVIVIAFYITSLTDLKEIWRVGVLPSCSVAELLIQGLTAERLVMTNYMTNKLESVAWTGTASVRDRIGLEPDDSVTFANLTASTAIRMATAIRRRYYHIPLESANPGASGATWVSPSATTTGGWKLDAAAETIEGHADIHSDWDGATNPTVGLKFLVNVDNTGGADADTVDLKLTCYYKGTGDTACKTQTVEVATVVGKSAQYKQFAASFAIDWDAAGNVLEAGDVLAFVLNLETDTSEVDDVTITSMEFYYPTTHVGLEAGDV